MLACWLSIFPSQMRAEEVDPNQWYIDPHATDVRFQVKELGGLRTVKGSFAKTYGQVEFNGEDLSSLKVHAEIDAEKIDTQITMRDNELKSDHFLDVSHNQMIVFDSTRIVQKTANEFVMYGNLKIRRHTKEVAVVVHGPDNPGKTARGKACFSGRATAKLHRKDFNLTHQSALMISDEILVFINVRLIEGLDPEAIGREQARLKRQKDALLEQQFKKERGMHQ
jgi:polyisoprenoid-binding protein YceI